jgi:hypothetical protein
MNTTNSCSNLFRLVIAAVAVSMIALSAAAQSVPALINYQGRLTAQTGLPITPSSYVIQFRLWNDPAASTPANLIWSQQQGVTVRSNGAFDVILGSSAGGTILGDTPAVTNLISAFGSTNDFLGLTVVSNNGAPILNPSEILPRQQLLSVPFAVQAQSANLAQQAQQAQISSSLVTNLAYALCPPGAVIAYMGTTAPPGWLICDGSLQSRGQYPALFSVIGISSGSGDGSTTFNLPDLRSMFLRGVTGGRTDAFADPDIALRYAAFAGGNSGNAVGSVQMDMFASHVHGGVRTPGGNVGSGNDSGYCGNSTTTAPAGGNETRSKNTYVNYIIKY